MVLFYAGQVARRADRRLPVLRNGRAALPSEQVDNVLTAAHLLSAQLRELGTARAWHPSGLADATGWAGVAVTEILVHGSDAASALHLELPIPAEACARTVSKVFPWIPPVVAAPGRLLLAATGRAEVHGYTSTRNGGGRRHCCRNGTARLDEGPLRWAGSKGHDRRTDRAELITWRTCSFGRQGLV